MGDSWAVARAPEGTDRLARLLRGGWEPFAATQGRLVVIIWLRRRVTRSGRESEA